MVRYYCPFLPRQFFSLSIESGKETNLQGTGRNYAIVLRAYAIPTRESKDKSPFDVDYLFLSFQCSLAPRRHRRIYVVAKQWLFENNIGRLSASGRSTLPSISRQFHCVTYRDRLILRLILVAFRILREIGVCIYIYRLNLCQC